MPPRARATQPLGVDPGDLRSSGRHGSVFHATRATPTHNQHINDGALRRSLKYGPRSERPESCAKLAMCESLGEHRGARLIAERPNGANDLGKRCLNCGIGARPTAAIAEFRPGPRLLRASPSHTANFAHDSGVSLRWRPPQHPAPGIRQRLPWLRRVPWAGRPRAPRRRESEFCAEFSVGPTSAEVTGPPSAARPVSTGVGPGQSDARGRARRARAPPAALGRRTNRRFCSELGSSLARGEAPSRAAAPCPPDRRLTAGGARRARGART